MPAIGYVTRNGNGFKGQLHFLAIPNVAIDMVPNGRKTNEKQPDYRVMAGSVEIGAAWNRRSEAGNDYVSVGLAAPELGPKRIYANLGPAAGQDDDDTFALIWNPVD
jgi:uncharacterized protein (DUF736 family)